MVIGCFWLTAISSVIVEGRIAITLWLLFERDLFRKPGPTFRDHGLVPRTRSLHASRGTRGCELRSQKGHEDSPRMLKVRNDRQASFSLRALRSHRDPARDRMRRVPRQRLPIDDRRSHVGGQTSPGAAKAENERLRLAKRRPAPIQVAAGSGMRCRRFAVCLRGAGAWHENAPVDAALQPG